MLNTSSFSTSNSQIDVAYKECEKINQLIQQEKEKQHNMRQQRMQELGNNSLLQFSTNPDNKEATKENNEI
jgi:hypothetical protein